MLSKKEFLCLHCGRNFGIGVTRSHLAVPARGKDGCDGFAGLVVLRPNRVAHSTAIRANSKPSDNTLFLYGIEPPFNFLPERHCLNCMYVQLSFLVESYPTFYLGLVMASDVRFVPGFFSRLLQDSWSAAKVIRASDFCVRGICSFGM